MLLKVTIPRLSSAVWTSLSSSRFLSTMATKYKVVCVRHGESTWNKLNVFTGWHDADLSEQGVSEAIQAGKTLKEKGFTFDVAYTSVLTRAIRTLYFIQNELDLHWIPVHRTWRLNERMYGDLQGLNKAETAAKHGEDKVKIWRRAYDTPPPKLTRDNKEWPGHDRRYANMDKNMIPLTECLKDTVERALPYWFDEIVPAIKRGESVLIAAHGNSLRALCKYLKNIPESEITELNIPTGIPLVFELDEELQYVNDYYLADQASVDAAINKVKNQGKAK